MALVFQYGSNMLSDHINSPNRLQGDACPYGIAYTADDYELEFTIWSRMNKCAAANIFPGLGRKIWGVVYMIPDYLISRETAGSRKSLDAIEGESQNYKRTSIAIRYADGRPVEEDVITYIALYRRTGIKTSFEYANQIISGLHEFNVSEDYIEYVKGKVLDNNPDIREKIEIL